MTEYSSYATKELATRRIADRIANRQRASQSRIPGQRRPRGRHALASSLHRFADRLEN
jgi:hypothetical protein